MGTMRRLMAAGGVVAAISIVATAAPAMAAPPVPAGIRQMSIDQTDDGRRLVVTVTVTDGAAAPRRTHTLNWPGERRSATRAKTMTVITSIIGLSTYLGVDWTRRIGDRAWSVGALGHDVT